jgi:hypothetical protein
MTSYEEIEEKGIKTALSSDSRPFIFPGNEWLFNAFMALDTTRYIGMAVGPIPWDKAMKYADRQDMDRETAAVLWLVIHRADTAFRAELSKTDR